jgi:hypothetical protein
MQEVVALHGKRREAVLDPTKEVIAEGFVLDVVEEGGLVDAGKPLPPESDADQRAPAAGVPFTVKELPLLLEGSAGQQSAKAPGSVADQPQRTHDNPDEALAHTRAEHTSANGVESSVPPCSRRRRERRPKQRVPDDSLPRASIRRSEESERVIQGKRCDRDHLQLGEMVLGRVEIDRDDVAGAGGDQRERRTPR